MTNAPIPYETQQHPRACGAAALCMVYRSLGLSCTQDEIWQRVARPGPSGNRRCTTLQLAADALEQGWSALILRGRDPWSILKLSLEQGIYIILNHRLTLDMPAGHYSVLVGLDEDSAILHDPKAGPERSVAKSELLTLWKAFSRRSETTGFVLLAIAEKSQEVLRCATCQIEFPATVDCPGCRQAFALQPAKILGCEKHDCPARTWTEVFCPRCDFALTRVP